MKHKRNLKLKKKKAAINLISEGGQDCDKCEGFKFRLKWLVARFFTLPTRISTEDISFEL